MSALGGAFEQGDRDIKLGKIDLSKLPPLEELLKASGKAPPAPAPVKEELALPPPAPIVAVSPAPPTPTQQAPAPAPAPAPVPVPAPAPVVIKATAVVDLGDLDLEVEDEGGAQDGASVKAAAYYYGASSPPATYSGPPANTLRTALLDLSEPIAKRTHAAFYLRTMATTEAIGIIQEALAQRQDSALMRHELAYILGQIGDPSACGTLTAILDTDDEDVLVRHECAEALGAIGSQGSVEILNKYKTHSERDISETCQIALELIAYRQSPAYTAEKTKLGAARYRTTDPAPAYTESKPIPTLQSELLGTATSSANSLFLRYRAMFTLRNLDTDDAALALCEGLKDSSPLFRHEVAYVLGQMQKEVTVPALTEVLTNTQEHRMVRHEAAEALGAIGGEEVELILGEFLDDAEVVVTESCEVALDTLDYWEDFKTSG